MTKLIINGYTIKYNSFWGMYQVSHDEIGLCGEFLLLDDAIEYANNG
jgi:fructose-1,6-bisphosphatase